MCLSSWADHPAKSKLDEGVYFFFNTHGKVKLTSKG